MKRLLAVAVLVLAGCSGGFQFSVMKQWDRPAERTITEDVLRSPEPKMQIKTQEPVRLETAPAVPAAPPAVPDTLKVEPKKMDHTVPQIIVPQTQGIQYMYIHVHGDDKHTCYTRKTLGIYAQNLPY